MSEYKRLDTASFNALIDNKSSFLSEYADIQKEYISAVEDLIEIWKGRGSEAFYDDAMAIKSNIVGIGDILQTMCDMLEDCKSVFEECDISLETVNRDAVQ